MRPPWCVLQCPRALSQLLGAVSLKLQTFNLWLKLSEFSPSLCLFRNEGLHGTRTLLIFNSFCKSTLRNVSSANWKFGNSWTLTSCWRLLLTTSANIPPDWLMGHTLFFKNHALASLNSLFSDFIFISHDAICTLVFARCIWGWIWDTRYVKSSVFLSLVSRFRMFSGKQISFGFLVIFCYNFWLADVLEVFLILYWKCSIHNVGIHTLHVFRDLGGHCHFSKCWSVPYVFLSYHGILNQNMLMSFMAFFTLVTVWFYFSNNIITCNGPFGWIGFGLATDWSGILIKCNWHHS